MLPYILIKHPWKQFGFAMRVLLWCPGWSWIPVLKWSCFNFQTISDYRFVPLCLAPSFSLLKTRSHCLAHPGWFSIHGFLWSSGVIGMGHHALLNSVFLSGWADMFHGDLIKPKPLWMLSRHSPLRVSSPWPCLVT